MKNNTCMMFNLQGLLIGKTEIINEKNEIILHVRSPRRFAKCPHCLNSTKKVHQNGTRLIKHGIVDFRIVVLRLLVRRFKCGHCAKVFTETFSGIDRRRTTVNFRLHLLEWLKRNSFRYIGQRFNMSPATLVRYLLDINDDIIIDWNNLNVTKLGIDEHSFRGRNLLITITDLTNKKLIAILENCNKKTLEDFFENMPTFAKKPINEVCIDLKLGYKNTAKEYLPNAIVTVDRFHVIQLANRVVDEIRSIVVSSEPRKMNIREILLKNKESLTSEEEERLKYIFKKYEKYPVLYQSWFIKEKLRRVYWAKDKDQAKERFNEVMDLLLDTDYSRYFKTFRNTLKNWEENILNFHEYKTTNAFTEGCHTKIKMMKRVSYGFRNIDNYIAKMSLAFLPLSFLISYHTV